MIGATKAEISIQFNGLQAELEKVPAAQEMWGMSEGWSLVLEYGEPKFNIPWRIHRRHPSSGALYQLKTDVHRGTMLGWSKSDAFLALKAMRRELGLIRKLTA